MSTATVSRVVHGHDRVRASTRQRVLDVIEALGYVPDGAAQSLSRKRKQVVGLVAVASRGPESDIEQTSLLFVEEVLRGVESSLGEIGWSLLISFVQAGDAAYQRLQSLSGKVDGLLIAEGIVSSQRAGPAARPAADRARGRLARRSRTSTSSTRTTGRAPRRWSATWSRRTATAGCSTSPAPTEAPDAIARRSAFDEVLAEHTGMQAAGYLRGPVLRLQRQAGGRRSSWRCPTATCRTRSSAPTTRWRSA